MIKMALTGELLDYGRLPAFSLLALTGAIIYFRHLRADGVSLLALLIFAFVDSPGLANDAALA